MYLSNPNTRPKDHLHMRLTLTPPVSHCGKADTSRGLYEFSLLTCSLLTCSLG